MYASPLPVRDATTLGGEGPPMNEEDFWARLEYRICDELARMGEKRPRALWCDGIVPRQFLVEEAVPRIIGYAWMATGSREQDQWDFVLFLPGPVPSQDALEWSSLLPPDGATDWLEIDQPAKTIQIHPTYLAPA